MTRILMLEVLAVIFYMIVVHPLMKSGNEAMERCTMQHSHDTCVYAFR